MARVSLL
ncbi:hypothetical protein D049_0658A, partial [Vibrio parahaemolyticus VPTS-2010]